MCWQQFSYMHLYVLAYWASQNKFYLWLNCYSTLFRASFMQVLHRNLGKCFAISSLYPICFSQSQKRARQPIWHLIRRSADCHSDQADEGSRCFVLFMSSMQFSRLHTGNIRTLSDYWLMLLILLSKKYSSSFAGSFMWTKPETLISVRVHPLSKKRAVYTIRTLCFSLWLGLCVAIRQISPLPVQMALLGKMFVIRGCE